MFIVTACVMIRKHCDVFDANEEYAVITLGSGQPYGRKSGIHMRG